MTIQSLLRKPKGLLALALLAFALAPTTVWGDMPQTRPPSSAEIENTFRGWAKGLMPSGLNDEEQNVLFDWQMFVVKKENRPWQDVARAEERAHRHIRNFNDWNIIPNARSRRLENREKALPKGFADFNGKDEDAPDFVERWFKKATAAGFKPSRNDTQILDRAKASKRSWSGNPNISMETKPWNRKIKIHESVPAEDLKAAHDALFGRLGRENPRGISLEFDEPDGETLKNAADIFCDTKIDALRLYGDGQTEVDLSVLEKYRIVHALELHDCRVTKGGLLSQCRELSTFTAKDCTLGELTFLSGCSSLNVVTMEGCSFTKLKNLWATAESLRKLSVANAKDTVDLAIVRKLRNLNTLDISGCRVTNFDALVGHPALTKLVMRKMKGGTESPMRLAENKELEIEFDRESVSPAVFTEFARAERQKEYADHPEDMLREAVKDRDLVEVKRLTEKKIKTDHALQSFKFTAESDLEIFRLLVPSASEYILTDELWKYLALLGYERSSNEKSSFVPTNRAEAALLLLKHGANPDNAIESMAHPAEVDLKLFEALLAQTSPKVKTELLQKNIKSFGNDLDNRKKNRQPADRLKVVQILLKNGADPNVPNFFGRTALGNAVEYDGDMALVKLLLDNGADVARIYPKTELFREFYQGNKPVWGTNRYELVELLLAHGFDANAKSRFGQAPLGEIVSHGGWDNGYDLKMAELLLKHGADPNARQNEHNGSATDMAYRKHDAKEILALLEKHGGKVSDEAKATKAKQENDSNEKRNRRERFRHRPDFDDEPHRSHGDSVHDEMDRFHRELRNARTPEEHQRVLEEHLRRMRELHHPQSRPGRETMQTEVRTPEKTVRMVKTTEPPANDEPEKAEKPTVKATTEETEKAKETKKPTAKATTEKPQVDELLRGVMVPVPPGYVRVPSGGLVYTLLDQMEAADVQNETIARYVRSEVMDGEGNLKDAETLGEGMLAIKVAKQIKGLTFSESDFDEIGSAVTTTIGKAIGGTKARQLAKATTSLQEKVLKTLGEDVKATRGEGRFLGSQKVGKYAHVCGMVFPETCVEGGKTNSSQTVATLAIVWCEGKIFNALRTTFAKIGENPEPHHQASVKMLSDWIDSIHRASLSSGQSPSRHGNRLKPRFSAASENGSDLLSTRRTSPFGSSPAPKKSRGSRILVKSLIYAFVALIIGLIRNAFWGNKKKIRERERRVFRTHRTLLDAQGHLDETHCWFCGTPAETTVRFKSVSRPIPCCKECRAWSKDLGTLFSSQESKVLKADLEEIEQAIKISGGR